MASLDASQSIFLPCKLLVYGAPHSGRRTLISRLLGERCLSNWTLEDKDLVNLDGENTLALSAIHLCGTSVQLVCVKNPKAEKHRDALAAVVLYDITSEPSLRYAERFIMEVQHSLPNVPVYLVGSKLDLEADSSLSEAAVQGSLSLMWPRIQSHCRLSAKYGHGMTAFVGAAVAIPFLREQYKKIRHRVMDWNVIAEQAMLWAFDHSIDSVVIFLKSVRMHLSATVIQLHSAAVERHLHRTRPWRAINVAAAQHGKSCRQIWKGHLTAKKGVENSNEISEEEKEIMLAMMHGTILVHEQKSVSGDLESWQAIDVDSDGDDMPLASPVMGCCVQWNKLMLETFTSTWLTSSCTGLSKEVITHLNLSHNQLTFLPIEVYKLPSLVCLALAGNLLTELPEASLWASSSKIQFLDISGNRIQYRAESMSPRHGSAAGGSRRDHLFSSTLSSNSTLRKRAVSDFTRSLSPMSTLPVADDTRYSLAPHLWYIDLSKNHLQSMPLWILRLPSLTYLDLSHNKLQDLPSSLTALTSLQELRVTSVANIPQHIVANGSASLLGHLGLAHYQGHAPAAPTANGTEERRLQMVTFGPKDSGKTALLAQLTGKRFDIADPAIHCLTHQQWVLNTPDRLRFFKPTVTVELWDYSGSKLCQPLHASIGSRYALYLAVCSMINLRQSCQDVARYLVQLQTLHSEPLSVVIAFTHYDVCAINKADREADKRQCINWVARLTDDDQVSVDGVVWPGHCRPKVLGSVFISSPSRGGISELHSLIYSTALDMTAPHRVGSDTLGNIALPLHCLQTESSIKAWLSTAEGYSAPMLVSISDLWQQLSKQKLLTISKTEFENALTLLGTLGLCVYFPPTPSSTHTTGLLVMHPDQLCSMIADVLRLTNRLSQTADDPCGIFQQSHLSMILAKYLPASEADDRLPLTYLSVLESLGICRCLSDGNLFLPSGLAPDFADAVAPLVWSEDAVARLFRVPCLSSIFWSLLLQRLAYSLQSVSHLYMSCPLSSHSVAELDNLHRKATFWRSGMLLRTRGCQALVRATPGSHSQTRRSDSRPVSPSSPPVSPSRGPKVIHVTANEIDVLVESSDDKVHVKLLQVITKAIVETVKQCSRSVPLVEVKGVLQCLLACPVCRGAAPRQHSLSAGVYETSIYHFNLTTCIMALDAQAEEENRRRRSSSTLSGRSNSSSSAPQSPTKVGCLGCGKHRLLVPLQTLIPDVLCEDLDMLLSLLKKDDAVSDGADDVTPASRSLPRVMNGKMAAPIQAADLPCTLSRHFIVNPTSMDVDCLLQPYQMMRWRTEALLLIQKDGLCPRPGTITPHPPVLQLPAPFKGTLGKKIEVMGRGFKRQQAHLLAFQMVDGLRHLLSKGLVHCDLNIDKIYLHNGGQLKVCLSDSGLRPLRNNDDLQEMFVQLGIVLYELVSGERLLCGILTTGQLVQAFRNRRLRPSLEDLLLDYVPLPTNDRPLDRQSLRPRKQPRHHSTAPEMSRDSRLCSSEGTRRQSQLYQLEKTGRALSNSDVSSVTHTVIDRLLSSCSKLCLQAVMEQCWSLAVAEQIYSEDILDQLQRGLVLCCSATQWSPASIQQQVTAVSHYPARKSLIWGTGAPRLQLGKLDLRTGMNQPQPMSFIPDTMPHLRNRHIAVRSEQRIMCMTIAEAVGQLWVCLERNTAGAVYVFNALTLEVMDSFDFNDDDDCAVLSVVAVPPARSNTLCLQQVVLVGLSSGDVLVFLASSAPIADEQTSPLKNCVCKLDSGETQPCMVLALGSSPTSVLCALGSSLCILDTNHLMQLATSMKRDSPLCVETKQLPGTVNLSSILVDTNGKPLLDRRLMRSGVTKLLPCAYGVWVIQRHSHIVILLDSELKTCKLLMDAKSIASLNDNTEAYVLCLAITGSMLWLGTRGGHVMLVNIPRALKMWNGRSVVQDSSLVLGLRQPLPNCRIFSLVAMADGALLSADAGGNAQAVCAVEKLASDKDLASTCVGVFVVDVAVDPWTLNT